MSHLLRVKFIQLGTKSDGFRRYVEILNLKELFCNKKKGQLRSKKKCVPLARQGEISRLRPQSSEWRKERKKEKTNKQTNKQERLRRLGVIP